MARKNLNVESGKQGFQPVIKTPKASPAPKAALTANQVLGGLSAPAANDLAKDFQKAVVTLSSVRLPEDFPLDPAQQPAWLRAHRNADGSWPTTVRDYVLWVNASRIKSALAAPEAERTKLMANFRDEWAAEISTVDAGIHGQITDKAAHELEQKIAVKYFGGDIIIDWQS